MQFYQLSQQSLAKSSSSIVEEYIPLWMADGTSVGFSGSIASAGTYWLNDGGSLTTGTASSRNLFTLNSNYNSSQKFAFETTIDINNNAMTIYAGLWDITSNSLVSGSTVSTSSGTFTVLRSSQFTLIPSHVYGVTIWCSSGGASLLITDANLIVFGQ